MRRMHKKTQKWSRDERGFTILQTAIAVAIMGIICGFAVMGLLQAKAKLRLQNSVRQLAGYLEKARLDAIRRHGTSNVAFIDSSTYVVTMDFGGTGTLTSRTIPFEQEVTVFSSDLPTFNFNWRGRTQSCTVTLAVRNGPGQQSNVDVSDAGDVTVDGTVGVFPSVSYAPVNTGSDVQTTAVVSGSTVHNNSVDCTGETTGTIGGTITGTGIGCADSATPSAISIRKNGAGSATITVTATNTGTISVQAPINLQVTPSMQTVSGGGSATFSITSVNNTRGTFAVNFNSPCTTLTVLLTVTN